MGLRICPILRCRAEATIEARETSDSQTDSAHVKDDGVTLENNHTSLVEHRGDQPPVTFVVIVVAQHGDYGDADLGELACQYLRLVEMTAVGQVTGEQQDISLLMNTCQAGTQHAPHPRCHVQIADSGQPHLVSADATHSANDSCPALASDGLATRLRHHSGALRDFLTTSSMVKPSWLAAA